MTDDAFQNTGDPLDEVVETSWLTFLNRFDREIYPVLFQPRGFTKDAALIAWTLNRYGGDLADLVKIIEDKYG